MKSVFTLLLLLFISFSHAQLNESFDTDLTTWEGNLEQFKLADRQLSLSDTAAGSAELFTKNSLIYAEWEITLQLAFAPSANNQLTIFLTADANQSALVKNGYCLKLGENGRLDALELVKISNGTETTLLRGEEIYGTEKDSISIKVIHQPNGTWQLFSDPNGMNDYTLEGSIIDNEIITSNYFGFVCDYTVTRAESFHFKEINIKEYKPDTIGPKIEKILINNNNSIIIYFNEIILYDSLLNKNINLNRTYAKGIEKIKDNIINVFFQEIQPNAPLQCSINSLYDLSGNKSDTTVTITYAKDTIPPQLTVALIINLTQARLLFDEPLLTDSLRTTSFNFNNREIKSFEAINNNEVIIQFNPIKTNTPYSLVLHQIYDETGNISLPYSTSIQLEALKPQDLTISEILYDPIAGTNSEFIELYNRTDKNISTTAIKFAKGFWLSDSLVIESLVDITELTTISPREYHVFSDLSNWVTIPPNSTHTKIPTLNNDGTTIILLNQFNEIIDYLSYDKSYHSQLIKETKGISLEKIDLDIKNQKSNWTSASSLVKSTPGETNSVNHQFLFKTTLTIEPKQLDFNFGATSFLFSYQFEGEKSGSCFLFNEKGQKLTDILNNEHLASQGIFTWSPSDSFNMVTGNYIIVWETWDDSGSKKIEKYVVSIIR